MLIGRRCRGCAMRLCFMRSLQHAWCLDWDNPYVCLWDSWQQQNMKQRNRHLKNLDSLGPVVQNKSQRFAVCMIVKQFFNPSKFPLFLANLSTESATKRLQNTCFIQVAALTHRFVMLNMISMISGVWTWTNRAIVFLKDFEDRHLYIQRWPFPHIFSVSMPWQNQKTWHSPKKRSLTRCFAMQISKASATKLVKQIQGSTHDEMRPLGDGEGKKSGILC